jgi:hypothetical protein
MLIFTLHTWQLIFSIILYATLFIQGYLLIKFLKSNTLLQKAVIGRLKKILYVFITLLIIKTAFNIGASKGFNITSQVNQTNGAYITGYYTDYYTGHYLEYYIFKNIDLIFVITFICLLIFVFKEAIKLKEEQELTI